MVLLAIATMPIEVMPSLECERLATLPATSAFTLVIISHLFDFKKSKPSKIFATTVGTIINRCVISNPPMWIGSFVDSSTGNVVLFATTYFNLN